MKQRIVKISNIEFTEPIRIKKPVDITQTNIYKGLKQFSQTISDDELIKRSHIGFVLAQLLNSYDCIYDVETITDDDEYQEAVDEIESYVETAWSMRDANLISSIELSDEYYNVEHQTTMYMYFNDWIEFGYKPFIRPTDWDNAFYQVIYEYMRQFLTIEVS